MKALTLVNVLIIASLVIAGVLGGLTVATVRGPGPTISIGSVVGVFSNGSMQLHLPVEIHNGGLISIEGAAISVMVFDNLGHQLISGSSGSFGVPPGATEHVNVTLTADMRDLPQSEMERLLTQDQILTFSASLRASVPTLVSVSGSATGSLPWRALMKNLTFGGGVIAPFNSTFSQVSWPFSFSNTNQYFRFYANVSGIMTDQSGRTVGLITPRLLEVSRGTTGTGNLTALVEVGALQAGSQHELTVHLVVQESRLFQTEISVKLVA
jgi:hypothetical protein